MAHATLEDVLRAVASDQGYRPHQLLIKEITSDGANYTSSLFLATISSPGKQDLNLFAKVACFSEKIRSRVNGDSLFRTEQLIYNKFVKIWNDLQDKYEVEERHRFVFPKFYGGSMKQGSETVVLENLITCGYGMYSRFKSVDWEHASKSVELMAKFHALSFILEKEQPNEYESVTKELVFEMPPEDESKDDILKKMFGSALSVLEEEDRNRVAKYLGSVDSRQIFMDFKMPRGRTVLVHGDYRPSNLLFRRQKGELEAIVLDYQTIHGGCPVADLIYFIFMGSDEGFRREFYHQLVDHYYQQLGLALRRFRIDVGEVYPRETFDEDLKEMLPAALMLGVVILPVVTVEAASAPRTSDCADLDSFIVQPNQLFAERFRGIVADLVRWGVV